VPSGQSACRSRNKDAASFGLAVRTAVPEPSTARRPSLRRAACDFVRRAASPRGPGHGHGRAQERAYGVRSKITHPAKGGERNCHREATPPNSREEVWLRPGRRSGPISTTGRQGTKFVLQLLGACDTKARPRR
jgi:hypothetical protein